MGKYIQPYVCEAPATGITSLFTGHWWDMLLPIGEAYWRQTYPRKSFEGECVGCSHWIVGGRLIAYPFGRGKNFWVGAL